MSPASLDIAMDSWAPASSGDDCRREQTILRQRRGEEAERTVLACLMARRTSQLLTIVLFPLCCFVPVQAKAQSRQMHPDRAAEWPQALRMAEFILSLQNAAGAIPDRPGATTVNEDSNMEYAPSALGAAYAATKDSRYKDGLE